ncbi:hypothetical protein BX281_10602 [Streptomyces sp. Ag82_O1-15]|nr:hypothetical protein BX281_10602 [Streptomyces sp. Ag82_O1-15]
MNKLRDWAIAPPRSDWAQAAEPDRRPAQIQSQRGTSVQSLTSKCRGADAEGADEVVVDGADVFHSSVTVEAVRLRLCS